MSWEQVVQQMSFRREIQMLAAGPEANIREICQRFKISRKTFYKWRKRWSVNGESGLKNQSRRPKSSPLRTTGRIEEEVVAVRQKHPSWGSRKIRRRLQDLGRIDVPSASTVHAILKRHDQIHPEESIKHQAWQRFEHEAPNQLWQMDFKGWFRTDDQQRCHPLTVLDDHSRYVVCLRACANQQTETVRHHLTETFRQYGLPERMTMDNGAPWGNDLQHRHTPLTVWLMRMGIRVGHSRPYHPQTQGKDERFHRTLDVDLLQSRSFRHLADVQAALDPYRHLYNHERPHQAIAMAVPATRYRLSPRSFPETLPKMEYDSIDIVRKVAEKGHIQFRRHTITVGKAFHGYPVAIRPTPDDAVFHVYFCRFKIHQFDLRKLS